MIHPILLFLYLIIAFPTSLITVKLIRKIAIQHRIGSLPSPRKIHQKFMPLLGGLGFTTGIIAAMILAQVTGKLPWSLWKDYLYFWIGLLFIIITGFLDDLKGLRFKLKLLGQTLSAIFLIIGGCKIQTLSSPLGEALPLNELAIPFTLLWIIFIINTINLMDGLDGLAGGVVLIITIGFLVIARAFNQDFLLVLGIGLIGGLLGFLRYNYHPASIFMGDTGSLQLGYLMAFLSIESLKIAGSHHVYFLTSFILLGVPITDTLIAFFRRLGQGKSPFLADNLHIHHRLLHLGLTHLQTVWMIYLLTLFTVIMGVLMVLFPGITALLIFFITIFFALFWIWRLGYIETRFSMQNLAYQFQKSIPIKKRALIYPNRIWHKLLLLLSDVITINAALYLTYWFKFNSGIISSGVHRPPSDYFNTPVFLFLTMGWIFLFWVNNLYHMEWDVSRFDKVWRVSRVSFFGILVLGILTSDTTQLFSRSHLITLCYYGFLVTMLVNLGRLLIIEIEKRLQIFEYSPKKTLIVGCNDIAKRVLEDISVNPHLIFDVVGFVSKTVDRKEFQGLPVLGSYSLLPTLIHEYKIEEVIIALTEDTSDDFIKIISICEPQQVKIKIPPGVHDIFTGRQVSLMSHAYLQVFPENMVLWQWMIKRLYDIVISIFALILLSPFFLFYSIYLRWKFKKSVFVRIPILGKNGIPFQMFVFRMTDTDYDYHKNPVYLGAVSELANYNGPISFLLKYRLYKLPQLINVLLGDMSFVGPRPEPQEWYEKYKDVLRFTHRRVSVRPGITGLAQVKYHYELSQKILHERIKFDIFYIENMSLRLDLRIILRTILLIFQGSRNRLSSSIEEKNEAIESGVVQKKE